MWVVGPPGAGKTTLVASYLAGAGLPAVWYHVDEGDADVASLFHHLGLAARGRSGRGPALPSLRPEHWADLPAFTRRYLRTLFRRLGPRFVLVLDDYQEAPVDCRLHDVVAEAIPLLPAAGRIVVISRTEPGPAYGHLRGRMRIISWTALRLTARESSAIARARGVRAAADLLRALHARCDGWVAGLVLMLDDAGKALAAPAGAARDSLFAYFAGETLRRTDGQTRQFLLRTAFLPWMTEAMAARLSGSAHADRTLHALAAGHFFTERSLSREPVYRYHPLFREFLLERAARELDGAGIADLRRRAARVMAETAPGDDDAVRLLREAREWAALRDLIVGAAPALVAQGRRQTLEEWVAGLPAADAESDPWVQYWLGTARTPLAPALARRGLERAFEGFAARGDRPGALSACCGVVGTILYDWADVTPLDRWIDWLEDDGRRHRGYPSPALEARVVSTMFYALMFRRPEHPDIAAWAERALALSRDADVDRRLQTGFLLTIYWLWIGEHARAAATLDLLRDLARSRDASPLVRLTCRTVQAYYHWHVAEPARCRAAVADGLQIARASGLHLMDAHLLAQEVSGALLAGDTARVHEGLRRLAPLAAGTGGLHEGQYRFLAAWAAHVEGDLAGALEHVRVALRIPRESGMPFPLAWTHLGAAQVLHDLGDRAEAAGHLAIARSMAARLGSPLLRYMCLAVEAHDALDHGDDERARSALREAFAVGRRCGLLAFPWWRPGLMARLCEVALEAGIEPDHARALIRGHRLVPPAPETAPETWPWPIAIRTLGGFELARDGRPVRFAGKVQRRPLALLEAIIAFGSRGVPAAEIGDALWPDAEGDAAHQVLATTLHRLRALLGRDRAVQLQDGRLTLDAEVVWADARAFERGLAEADGAERAGRADAAAGLRERALGLYRGPFLRGEPPAAWVIEARARLHDKFLRATAWLGQHWSGRQQWMRALEGYERGLQVDDLAEELYRGVMRCCLGLGRRAEGLHAYERCRLALASRLGVRPSPETQALRDALRE